jgi:hypothetical protein
MVETTPEEAQTTAALHKRNLVIIMLAENAALWAHVSQKSSKYKGLVCLCTLPWCWNLKCTDCRAKADMKIMCLNNTDAAETSTKARVKGLSKNYAQLCWKCFFNTTSRAEWSDAFSRVLSSECFILAKHFKSLWLCGLKIIKYVLSLQNFGSNHFVNHFLVNYCENSYRQRLKEIAILLGDPPTSGLWSLLIGVLERLKCLEGAQKLQKIGLNWKNSKVFSFQRFSRAGERFWWVETTPPFTKYGPAWYNFSFYQF